MTSDQGTPTARSRESGAVPMRCSDRRCFNAVRWIHFALPAACNDFVGHMPDLDPDWAARLVAQVGNYREVWERNIGSLGIRRGLNLLWTQGGLQYAPPMR